MALLLAGNGVSASHRPDCHLSLARK